MSSYTQQKIDKANTVSLPEFLMSQGEQHEKSGQEYRWKKHDSMTIRENKWFCHSRSKGGYPIDFVMEFMGKTFPEAVKMLIGEDPPYASDNSNDRFRLPKRNKNNEAVTKYLTEDRCLDKKIVEAFLLSGDVYEDEEHHNVVFVGRDRNGIPRYASCRGTNKKFRKDVLESDKSYGFSHEGTDHRLFVFEAPIDLMSFISLYSKD